MPANPTETTLDESSVNFQTFLSLLLAMSVGLLLAVLLLPRWMPNLGFSLSGEAPRAFWYLARASALASLTLLWISMVLGLGISNKLARLWPGAPASFAIHEYVSLLGLAFALFHALILLGDRYIGFTLVQLLMPFSTAAYRPLWVGLGQLGFYLWLLLTISFYVRKGIGQKTWRLLHYGTFLMYVLGISHAIFSGTDSGTDWVQKYYWFTAGSLLFLLVYRILASMADKLFPQKPRPAPARAVAAAPIAAQEKKA